MKIVFVVPQRGEGSTMIGRILPVAQHWATTHDVHVLHLNEAEAHTAISLHQVGHEPFNRTPHGKKRLKGLPLVASMLSTAGQVAWRLFRLRPDVVVISKTLPHTVLGVWLWQSLAKRRRIILDVDDFELVANKLSSLTQRAAVHWAERVGVRLATHIVTATPFLSDHFSQLSGHKKPVTLIPTGLTLKLPQQPQEPKDPTLTYFGSISRASGHRVDLLPEILRLVRQQNPSVHLLMAGDGDDRAALEAEFEKYALSAAVKWHGRFTSEDIPLLLDQTTILIDPIDDSLTQRAKSSYRVALAAVAGKPVVSSNIGVRPHFVPSQLQQRFFAAPSDPASYAEKIVALLNTPLTHNERQMLQKHSAQYTWDALCQQYSKLLSAS